MSGGQLLGGVLGGIIGSFFGPIGAAIGFGLGSGIGGYIDPVSTPNITPPGAPKIQELNIPTAKEGDILPELLGTSLIFGNIVHYWGNRNEEIKQTQTSSSGGKGGGGSSTSTSVVGHNYYLSWIQQLCLGPTDVLYAVYKAENLVWIGELQRLSENPSTISLMDFSDDEGNGVSLGNLTFYFGTNDQTANPLFGIGLEDPTLNIPYRNICYAFFDDIFIGRSNRVPTFKFILAKQPVLSFNANGTVGFYDYNGAHVVWWILEKLAGIPSDLLDTTSFSDSADTLYTEEFGLSILMDSQASAQSYLDNVLNHLNAITFYDTDGKLHLKLIRKDVDLDDMLSISDDDLLEKPTFSRGSWDDTINEVKIKYPQRIAFNPDDNPDAYSPVTVIVDIANNWGDPNYMGFRRFDFFYEESLLNTTSWTADATSYLYYTYRPDYAINGTFTTKTGDPQFNSWLSSSPTFQRYTINCYPSVEGVPFTFDSIVINNFHNVGLYSNAGIKDCKIYTSPDLIDDFIYGNPNLVYGDPIPNSTLIFDGTIPKHVSADVVDDYLVPLKDLIDYFDEPHIKYKESIAYVDDIANKDIQGKAVSETFQFPLIQKIEHATTIADRILKSKAFPLASISLITNRNGARFQRGDLFKWSYSPYGITDMICRVIDTKEESLESENIILNVKEDIDYISNSVDTTNIDLIGSEGNIVKVEYKFVSPLVNIKVIEAPFIIAGEQVSILPIASRVTGNEIGFQVYISIDAGVSYSLIGSCSSFAPSGTLVAEYPDTTYTIDDTIGFEIDSTDVDISLIENVSRSALFIDTNFALLGDELISFQTITPDSVIDDRYAITGIYRGRIDTNIETHAPGTKFFFVSNTNSINLTDSRIVTGAALKFKYVPYSSIAGNLSDATPISHTITGRAKTPYHPINLTGNGDIFNSLYTSDIVLVWESRLRTEGAGIGLADPVTDATPTWEGFFEIEVYVNDVLVRTTTEIDALTWTYSSAMNNSDNGGLADSVVFKLFNYLTENNYKYESSQIELTVNKE